LEGVSGIHTKDQVKLGNDPQDAYAVSRLMADINAAVDGAFAGGAAYVKVLDRHRGGRNFDLSLLDSRAVADRDDTGFWWGQLDETYDAALYIGAHAMMGAYNAFLPHTCSTEWHNYIINGRNFGELGMWALVCGYYNVPIIMVSGDLAACQEASAFFNPVRTAVVKHAVSASEALCINDEDAFKTIRDAAKEAMGLIGKAKPFKPILPMEIRIEYIMQWGENPSERFDGLPGVERLDGRTLRKISHNQSDIFIR
jgi:D-amino peptidase